MSVLLFQSSLQNPRLSLGPPGGLPKLRPVRSKHCPRSVQCFYSGNLFYFVVDSVFVGHRVLLQVIITMRTLRLDCRVTVASLVVVCLSASGVWLRGESVGEGGEGQVNEQADVQVCSNVKLELTGTGEKGQAFKFKCPTGWTLSPVADPETKKPPERLTKVNVFVPAQRQESCTPQEKPLGQLVPGSTLEETSESPEGLAENNQAGKLLYTLTLGDAQEEAKHLCYICKAPKASDGVLQSRTSSPVECTIYVTVPAKKQPESSPQPDPKPDQQPGQNSDPHTDPKPDNPSDSGSSSLSVFGWLMLCVAGYVLELMVHL